MNTNVAWLPGQKRILGFMIFFVSIRVNSLFLILYSSGACQAVTAALGADAELGAL
jgi:hypothetical protein